MTPGGFYRGFPTAPNRPEWLAKYLLLALTARDTGALFITTDGPFETLRRLLPFRLRKL